jgi:hypothetical protein
MTETTDWVPHTEFHSKPDEIVMAVSVRTKYSSILVANGQYQGHIYLLRLEDSDEDGASWEAIDSFGKNPPQTGIISS